MVSKQKLQETASTPSPAKARKGPQISRNADNLVAALILGRWNERVLTLRKAQDAFKRVVLDPVPCLKVFSPGVVPGGEVSEFRHSSHELSNLPVSLDLSRKGLDVPVAVPLPDIAAHRV